MKKIGLVISLTILMTVIAIVGYSQYQRHKIIASVDSYDTCVAAGFAVQESYPPRCVTSNGKAFTQDIGNELEYKNLIIVDTPRPNQTIASPLTISGKARGQWYFEASFPIELVDTNGKSLGTAIAQAEGEWMTEEFVPFTAQLAFSTPATTKGTLILKNDNPSGLPENEKKLMIPVVFK